MKKLNDYEMTKESLIFDSNNGGKYTIKSPVIWKRENKEMKIQAYIRKPRHTPQEEFDAFMKKLNFWVEK